MGRRPKITEPKRRVKRKKLKKNLLNLEGLVDLLPEDMVYFRKIDDVVRNISDYYNFKEIKLPYIENNLIFEHSLGKDSHIFQNIYNLKLYKEELSLRPDLVSGIVRSYIQNRMNWSQPVKIFTNGPVFRYLKKEKKHQQLWQFCLNVLGNNHPIYDVLIIKSLYNSLIDLKIKDLVLEININGCDACYPAWNDIIKKYFSSHQKNLCSNCRNLSKNDIRKFLCCDKETCKEIGVEAPKMLDNLCQKCCKHFMAVMDYLESIKLPFNINHQLVSEFDYYTRTLFRIIEPKKNLLLAEGGRYDYLIEVLGGKSLSGMSGSLNVDKILNILRIKEKEKDKIKDKNDLKKDKKKSLVEKNRVFLILLGDLAKKKGMVLLESLKGTGILISESFGHESFKNQLGQAENKNIPIIVIIGQKEVADNTVIVKNRISGSQEVIPFEKLAENLKKRIKGVKM